MVRGARRRRRDRLGRHVRLTRASGAELAAMREVARAPALGRVASQSSTTAPARAGRSHGGSWPKPMCCRTPGRQDKPRFIVTCCRRRRVRDGRSTSRSTAICSRRAAPVTCSTTTPLLLHVQAGPVQPPARRLGAGRRQARLRLPRSAARAAVQDRRTRLRATRPRRASQRLPPNRSCFTACWEWDRDTDLGPGNRRKPGVGRRRRPSPTNSTPRAGGWPGRSCGPGRKPKKELGSERPKNQPGRRGAESLGCSISGSAGTFTIRPPLICSSMLATRVPNLLVVRMSSSCLDPIPTMRFSSSLTPSPSSFVVLMTSRCCCSTFLSLSSIWPNLPLISSTALAWAF